jgi:hypothetical protein
MIQSHTRAHYPRPIPFRNWYNSEMIRTLAICEAPDANEANRKARAEAWERCKMILKRGH